MPLVRISDSLYEKIQRIIERTGYKSIAYTLDKLTEQVKPEDFSRVEVEVVLKVVEREDGG